MINQFHGVFQSNFPSTSVEQQIWDKSWKEKIIKNIFFEVTYVDSMSSFE
jgi:hypothetical protein